MTGPHAPAVRAGSLRGETSLPGERLCIFRMLVGRPLSSEAALFGFLKFYPAEIVPALALATLGNTLGGFGTGLAIVGAYVLAGELVAAYGDHRVAFQRYEEEFRSYASISKKSSAGPFLAPGSRTRMRLRNWTFKSAFLLRMMLKMTDKFATGITLKDYPS